MAIRPVRTEADHDAALARIEALWDAQPGTPEHDEFEVLAIFVAVYEDAHYPILPPDLMADVRPSTPADGIPDERPPRGSPESAAWFRAALLEIDQTQASMARLMKRKGDDRKPATIERNIQRMAAGTARVSGEMRVVLTMMRSGKRQAEKRIGAKAAERAPTFENETSAEGEGGDPAPQIDPPW